MKGISMRTSWRKALSALLCGFLATFAAHGTAVANPGSESISGAFPTEQEISAAIDTYVLHDNGRELFDAVGAENDRVDQRIIDVGAMYNAMIDPAETSGDGADRIPNLQNRWRYCGKNNSGPGAPLNSADAACKRHDECLASGKAYCWCDTQFVYDLRRIRNHYSGVDRVYIEAAIQAVPRYHGCAIPA